MEEIYDYIAMRLQAPENALGQYNWIADAIEKLDVFPERVRVMESEPEHTMGFKAITCRQLFCILCNQRRIWIVTRVLYGASDISRRLIQD